MSTYTGTMGIASGIPNTIDEVNPTHELGEKIYTSDGRAFRYVKAGETLVVSELLQGPAEATGNQSRIVAAAAVGDKTITTTDTVTVTANEYAGGFVVVTGEASTGTGFQYRIKSHPAASAAVVTLTLEDPIQVALTATTQVDLVKNPYKDVITNPTTSTGVIVGVAVNEITSGQYGWVQVEGLATVQNDTNGTLTVRGTVVASGTTAGKVRLAVNGTTEAFAIVGTVVTGVAASESGAIKLSIG